MSEARSTGISPGSPRWAVGAVLGIAGLLYAYAVWNAVAHLINMARTGLTGSGWITLLFGVVFPVIVFVFAFLVGRRRRVGELALSLLAGLGIVAVFWMSLIALSLTLPSA